MIDILSPQGVPSKRKANPNLPVCFANSCVIFACLLSKAFILCGFPVCRYGHSYQRLSLHAIRAPHNVGVVLFMSAVV